MVKPRIFGAFSDVRDPAHVTSYDDLLIPSADHQPEEPDYLNSVYVVQQTSSGDWKCPFDSVPFIRRKKETTCSNAFDGPELVMKHIGKHMIAEKKQLGGYVYFVDLAGNSVGINTTGYRNVGGPLKDTLGNAVHFVSDLECASCEKLITDISEGKGCATCPCMFHMECLKEGEAPQEVLCCKDCVQFGKDTWQEAGAEAMKQARIWKNPAKQDAPKPLPEHTSAAHSDKNSDKNGDKNGDKSSDKSSSGGLTEEPATSNFADTAPQLAEEPNAGPRLAEKLLNEMRMRTVADIKRDRNHTRIAIKRVKVEKLREENEQKRLCLEEKRLVLLLDTHPQH